MCAFLFLQGFYGILISCVIYPMPQVRLQVETKKRSVNLGLAWLFWWPFNRFSFSPWQALFPHPPKPRPSISQQILPKFRRHKAVCLLHRFVWEVTRSLMGKNRAVCAQMMGQRKQNALSYIPRRTGLEFQGFWAVVRGLLLMLCSLEKPPTVLAEFCMLIFHVLEVSLHWT